MTTTASLDVVALNQALQPLVMTCFWGTLATAVLVPVADTIGRVIAGKIEKK